MTRSALALPVGPEVLDGILYRSDELAARAVEIRLGGRPFGENRSLGIVREGALIGGAVFHNFTDHGADIAIAVDHPSWARPRALRRLFEFAFVYLGRVRMSARTEAGNARARRLLEGIGCTLEGYHPRDFDGRRDAVSYGLLSERCRWIEDTSR